jgi:hypothetical protein
VWFEVWKGAGIDVEKCGFDWEKLLLASKKVTSTGLALLVRGVAGFGICYWHDAGTFRHLLGLGGV